MAVSGGFRYFVSDEQLAAFGRLSLAQRLEWVEAAREFSMLGQNAESRAYQERLRQGEPLLMERLKDSWSKD